MAEETKMTVNGDLSILKANSFSNGENGDLEAKLFVPKNDNLVPLMKEILGSYLHEQVKQMAGTLRCTFPYRNGEIEIQTARAEGIAKDIIEQANPRYVGISGSDFVLVAVLGGRYGHFREVRIREEQTKRKLWKVDSTGKSYIDLSQVIDTESGLQEGDVLSFISEDKDLIVRMRILHNYPKPPFLCVLGPNDLVPEDKRPKDEELNELAYKELIRRKKAEGRPIRAIWEERYDPLALNFIRTESERCGFDFVYKTVPGSSEGYVRKGGEPDRPELYDIAIEIGRTFNTARKNELEPYKLIMETYPVGVVCCKTGEEDQCRTLQEIVEGFSK